MHPASRKTGRWLIVAAGVFVLFLLAAAILSGSVYFYAYRNGVLDTIGAIILHPTIANRVGPIKSYQLFYWSTALTVGEGQAAFYARVFVRGERGNGSVFVWLTRKSGAVWLPTRLELLASGETSSVPDAERWYSEVKSEARPTALPLRKFPIPISPGIVAAAIVIGVMGVWLLIISLYVRGLRRLSRRVFPEKDSEA